MTQLVNEESKTVWAKAQQFSEKAVSFAKAVTSGYADEALIEKRLSTCHACEKLDKSPDGYEYCGACGCGRWPLARLDRKLALKSLPCPLGKEGFSNAGKPGALTPCTSCNQPRPPLEPLSPGDEVIIAVKLKGEAEDRRPWRVSKVVKKAPEREVTVMSLERPGEKEKAKIADEAEAVYEIARSRRGWDWLRHWGRKERADVSRGALGLPGDAIGAHH